MFAAVGCSQVGVPPEIAASPVEVVPGPELADVRSVEVRASEVSTGEVERITDLAASTAFVDFPTWSADGKTIYFVYRRVQGDLYLIE